MADTFTSKIGLRKWDPLSNYDISQVNANSDAIDGAIGNVTISTSTGRPSTPYEGQFIIETDTGNNYVYHSSNWYCTSGFFTSTTRPAHAIVNCRILETDKNRWSYFNGSGWTYLPGQRLGSAVYAGGGGTVTTELSLATLTTTLVAGRLYRVTLNGCMKITSAGSPGWYVARFKAGASVATTDTACAFLEYGGAVTGNMDDRSKMVEFTSPGAGQYTFGLFAASPVTGSVTINANSGTQPQSLILDDVGIA